MMGLETKDSHDLNDILQKMAANDWPQFSALIGEECLIKAKVCLLVKRGKSLGQMSNSLKMKRWVIRHLSEKKCNC
jgi:hypothetical protein